MGPACNYMSHSFQALAVDWRTEGDLLLIDAQKVTEPDFTVYILDNGKVSNGDKEELDTDMHLNSNIFSLFLFS